MNYSIIRYILCRVLEFAGIFFALPAIIGVLYEEKAGLVFLGLMIVCVLCGVIGKQFKPKSTVFYAREGFVTVSLSWILLSVLGALPFYLSGEIPGFTDALYETVSGLTTTGASILSDVEVLSRSTQFWRCFTHWIGGMGVLVFILAILPLSGSYNMHLMRAESPGPSVGKLMPRVKHTAMVLYGIYICFTVLEIISLVISGLSIYDSVVLTFSTVGTGGFGVLNTSVAGYPLASRTIMIVFMILCGINFNIFYLLLIRRPKEIIKSDELKIYLGILLAASLVIAWNARGFFETAGEAFHHALFQVASVMTTTGFSTVDYNLWPEFSKTVLILVMFIGACAGSTGGGIKVSRIVVMFRSIKNAIITAVHPRSIKKIHMNGHIVSDGVTHAIQVYILTYAVIFLGSVLLLSINGFDFVTNFTAVLANLNNVGPGLNLVGPTGNYADFSVFSKYLLMFDMLIGRLELFPMLVLFSPATWRKQ